MNFDISKFLSTLDGTEQDAWRKSKFYAWQSQGNKQKGITGENMIAEYLTDAGYINDKQGGGSASYDLCFNGVKIEGALPQDQLFAILDDIIKTKAN